MIPMKWIIIMEMDLESAFGEFKQISFAGMCDSDYFVFFQMATDSLEIPMVGENFSFHLVPDLTRVVNEPRNT